MKRRDWHGPAAELMLECDYIHKFWPFSDFFVVIISVETDNPLNIYLMTCIIFY